MTPPVAAAVSVVLAHAGPGHTWQGMVVVAGVTMAVFVVLAAIGRITVERPDDLVVPLAVSALVSSLAPLGSQWISDGIGFGLPLAIIAFVTLLLGALTPLTIRLPGPLAMGSIALTAVSIFVLYTPLTAALHPPAELLPLATDSEIAVVQPADGESVPAGSVEVVVRVTGGTIGPGNLTEDQLPEDPEEAGMIAAAIEDVPDDGSTGQRQRIELSFEDRCPLEAPCEEVSFTVDTEPGTTYQLTVDFTRGDGIPLAPLVRDRVTFTTG